MKNLIIVILGIAVLALGGYVITLKQDTPPVVASVPTEPAPVETATPIPPPPAKLLEPPESVPDPVLDEADEQLKEANDLITALLGENEELEKETQPSLANGIKQIIESPELKNMMRAGMSQNIKQRHGALFRKLNLTPEQEEALSELLIENDMAGIQTGIQWMTGNHEESSARTIAARELMHEEIGKMLGPQKLEEYKYWENSKNERESVQRFQRGLGDQKLDDATSDQLVDMMVSTRKQNPELDRLSQPEHFNPKEMTEEKQENLLGQVEELHGSYVEKAAPILNEEQLGAYEKSLGRQRRELQGFLRMSNRMFNSTQPPPQP